MNLLVMGEIAGVNMASLGECLHSKKMRARWREGFLDKLSSQLLDLESNGLHQVVLCP